VDVVTRPIFKHDTRDFKAPKGSEFPFGFVAFLLVLVAALNFIVALLVVLT
jgi:hypothetical protein